MCLPPGHRYTFPGLAMGSCLACHTTPLQLTAHSPTPTPRLLPSRAQVHLPGPGHGRRLACNAPPDLCILMPMIASLALHRYIFPGLAMGAFLARGNIVTDGMLMGAAESLS